MEAHLCPAGIADAPARPRKGKPLSSTAGRRRVFEGWVMTVADVPVNGVFALLIRPEQNFTRVNDRDEGDPRYCSCLSGIDLWHVPLAERVVGA